VKYAVPTLSLAKSASLVTLVRSEEVGSNGICRFSESTRAQ
jgi:hypothetical protein